MIRIKANKDIEGVITEGKVYGAVEFRDGYVFKNDVGKHDYAHKSHFMPYKAHDKPAIEVGSEWINKATGETVSVKYASSLTVVYGSEENYSTVEGFRSIYKPKPKTVTMYFYKIGNHLCANDYMPQGYTLLFIREIKLP